MFTNTKVSRTHAVFLIFAFMGGQEVLFQQVRKPAREPGRYNQLACFARAYAQACAMAVQCFIMVSVIADTLRVRRTYL